MSEAISIPKRLEDAVMAGIEGIVPKDVIEQWKKNGELVIKDDGN